MEVTAQRTGGGQSGITFWQFLVLIVVIGFVALMVIKTVPIYLNEFKVVTAVDDVSRNPDLGTHASVHSIRRSLEDHWEIDSIGTITPNDIAIGPDSGGGRTLSWDYEARVNLFMNVFLVVHFTGSKAMRDY